MLVSTAIDGDMPFIRARIEHARLDPEGLRADRILVWRDGELIAAFGRIKGYDGGIYELCSVFVDDLYRGRGLGAEVVRELMRRFPVPDVYITTDLVEYFARFGFVAMPADEVPPAIAGKLARVCGKLREGVVAMHTMRPFEP